MPPLEEKASKNAPNVAAPDDEARSAAVHCQSAAAARPEYWRAAEQGDLSPEHLDAGAAEFPMLRDAMARHDRRDFLKLLGASLALAGVTTTGCRRWPKEELRPHTARPEGSTPGVAEYYATMFELAGVAHPILAKCYDGRPIKVEGNPDHPAVRGSASPWTQAHILDLYDPDRSRGVTRRKTPGAAPESQPWSGAIARSAKENVRAEREHRTWAQFEAAVRPRLAEHRARDGEGLAFLVQPTSSPTRQRLIDDLRRRMPKARWFTYQPLHQDHVWAGSAAAFGRVLRCQYNLNKADVVVSFSADLLGSHPDHLRIARDWAARRKTVDQGKMNRLLCLESSWSLTGSVADYRAPLRPSEVESALELLAARLGAAVGTTAAGDKLSERVAAIANELLRAGGAGLVAVGPTLSARAHHLAHALNERLGSAGKGVFYTDEPLAQEAPQGCLDSIRRLSEQLQGNVIQTLVVVDGNPVYDAPVDAQISLPTTEDRDLLSIHLSSHENETSRVCDWHVPMVHALEAWGDGRSWDGTHTLGQPLIQPIFDGKSPLEFLAWIAGTPVNDGGRRLVRDTFDQLFPAAGSKGWELAVHDGFRRDSGYQSVAPPAVQAISPRSSAGESWDLEEQNQPDRFEIELVGDAKTHDGRFANNAWCQELPDPLTKLTWDNAALISKADADRLGVSTGSLLRLEAGNENRAIEAPVFVMPGQAVGCIGLALGYGRTSAGRIGNGVGVNAYPLRSVAHSYVIPGVGVAAASGHYDLASTQMHFLTESIADFALQKRLGKQGQPGLLVHESTLTEYKHDSHAPHAASHATHDAPLYNKPSQFDDPHKWAMAIDLNACIGCGGCVVACQAENNIPVVGKANVAMNREMHWLRIDRYFKGGVDEPDIVHIPSACTHCENAPCEQVCPVAATVHDSEGLNAMIYNRCIGTRYCANNCPFKARRFNYFDYQATDPREPAKPWLDLPDRQQAEEVSTLKSMAHNPDVTVRMRGVMEKCTYCVQRIVETRGRARNEVAQGVRETAIVREGEVQTACQATCPTQAIVFGDLNDPRSAVSRARHNPRSYEMLSELNLSARTTYLAKIRNRDA